MFNLFSRAFCPALVLISGLVSCAPDEKQKDKFVAPPPRIIRGGQAIELQTWDRDANKNLDIQDLVDASAAHPASIDVVSRCRHGQRDMDHKIQKSGAQISVFQLLPAEILAGDLREKPVTCSFEMILRNGQGSKHIFNIAFAQIKDERDPTLIIGRVAQNPIRRRERLTLPTLEGLRVRADLLPQGQAHVLCQDFKTAEIQYQNTVQLGDLDFARLIVHPGKPANAGDVRPLQLCRAVVSEAGLPQAVSSIFELQLPRRPVEINAVSLPFRTPDSATPIARGFLGGQGAPVGDYRMTNVSAGTRWLKIPKGGLPARMTIAGDREVLGSILRPYVFLSKPGGVLKEEQDHWLVAIPGNSSVPFSAGLQVPPIFSKHSPYEPSNTAAVIFDFPSLEVTELSEYGSELGRIPLALGPRMFIVVRPTAYLGSLPQQIPDKPLMGL